MFLMINSIKEDDIKLRVYNGIYGIFYFINFVIIFCWFSLLIFLFLGILIGFGNVENGVVVDSVFYVVNDKRYLDVVCGWICFWE